MWWHQALLNSKPTNFIDSISIEYSIRKEKEKNQIRWKEMVFEKYWNIFDAIEIYWFIFVLLNQKHFMENCLSIRIDATSHTIILMAMNDAQMFEYRHLKVIILSIVLLENFLFEYERSEHEVEINGIFPG